MNVLTPSRSFSDSSAELATPAALGIHDSKTDADGQGCTITSPDHEATAADGVIVPAFLQALLGVDFVPYLPAENEGTTGNGASAKKEKEDPIESSDYDVAETLSILGLVDEGLVCWDSKNSDDIVADGAEEEGNKPKAFSIDTGLELPATSIRSNNENRRRRTPRRMSSFIKSLKRRVGTTNSSNSSNHSKSKSVPCDSSLHQEDTPKRKGRTIVGTSLLETVRSQHGALQKHQARLLKVREESAAVRMRAGEIENRVAELQKQTAALQHALESSIRWLEAETMALSSTKDHLGRLDQEADQAMQGLEETLRALRMETALQQFPAQIVGSQRLHYSDGIVGPPTVTPVTSRHARSATDGNVPLPTSAPLLFSNLPEERGLLRMTEATTAETPMRSRANTAPTRTLSTCSSFMRTHDLEVGSPGSSISSSLHSLPTDSATTPPLENHHKNNTGKNAFSPLGVDDDFFFLDQNVSLILDKLFQLGFAVATDESARFTPTRDTQRRLKETASGDGDIAAVEEGWPVHPWHAAKGTDVLTWTGGVDHEGFGHDWPVVKARGIVQTSPRELLRFLLDSTQVKRYNKMSQGREDLLILQEGVDTTADESKYGFAGDAKIVRALVKPKMLPKTIEMLSLWYSKPIESAPGAYMIVSRSVWEEAQVTSPSNHNVLRSEMLLGVQLLRPCSNGKCCELTTVTHVFSPGVPELMAKRFAPGSATGMIREIQEVFRAS